MIDAFTAREYVQRGLTIRDLLRRDEAAKAAAIQQEAAQQAAERSLHEDVNFHSKWNRLENEAAQAHQNRDKRAHDQRAARRAVYARKNEQWGTYLKRTIIPVGIAGALNVLHAIGGVELWLALTGMTLCGLYIIINCAAYTARNQRKEVAHG